MYRDNNIGMAIPLHPTFIPFCLGQGMRVGIGYLSFRKEKNRKYKYKLTRSGRYSHAQQWQGSRMPYAAAIHIHTYKHSFGNVQHKRENETFKFG